MSLVSALLPVFSLILLGLLLKKIRFPGDKGFWDGAERLIYYVLFPSLLFTNLASAELEAVPVGAMAGVLAGAVLIVTLTLLLIRPLLGIPGAAFSSLFQGAIRQNTYVGLAGAAAIAGSRGLTLASVAIAVLIPLLNLLSVGVLSYFSGGRGWGRALLEIVRNPLILACVAGIALNYGGISLPNWIADPLAMLGRAALPLGLLSVGAALRLTVGAGELKAIVLASAAKLLLIPWLVWLGCGQVGLEAQATTVALLFAAVPTSVSSYILARQLGGDEHLMAAIITVQTLLAMVSMPWVLSWSL